jgi:hypothetical protein
MARPKDIVSKGVQFHSRITAGEAEAIEKLVRLAHAEDSLVDDRTSWFRWLVKREAKRLGVTIVEPGAPAAPAPEPTPVAPKKKRGQ